MDGGPASSSDTLSRSCVTATSRLPSLSRPTDVLLRCCHLRRPFDGSARKLRAEIAHPLTRGSPKRLDARCSDVSIVTADIAARVVKSTDVATGAHAPGSRGALASPPHEVLRPRRSLRRSRQSPAETREANPSSGRSSDSRPRPDGSLRHRSSGPAGLTMLVGIPRRGLPGDPLLSRFPGRQGVLFRSRLPVFAFCQTSPI